MNESVTSKAWPDWIPAHVKTLIVIDGVTWFGDGKQNIGKLAFVPVGQFWDELERETLIQRQPLIGTTNKTGEV